MLPYSTVLSEKARQALASTSRLVIAGFATGFFNPDSRIELRAPGEPLSSALGVCYEGFEPAPTPYLEGPASVDGTLMQTRMRAAAENIILRGLTGLPLLVKHNHFVTLAFDLGTLYARTPEDQLANMWAWVKVHLGL